MFGFSGGFVDFSFPILKDNDLDLCPVTLDLEDVTSGPWGHDLRPCRGRNPGSNSVNGYLDSVAVLSNFRPRYSKIMTLNFAPWFYVSAYIAS